MKLCHEARPPDISSPVFFTTSLCPLKFLVVLVGVGRDLNRGSCRHEAYELYHHGVTNRYEKKKVIPRCTLVRFCSFLDGVVPTFVCFYCCFYICFTIFFLSVVLPLCRFISSLLSVQDFPLFFRESFRYFICGSIQCVYLARPGQFFTAYISPILSVAIDSRFHAARSIAFGQCNLVSIQGVQSCYHSCSLGERVNVRQSINQTNRSFNQYVHVKHGRRNQLQRPATLP